MQDKHNASGYAIGDMGFDYGDAYNRQTGNISDYSTATDTGTWDFQRIPSLTNVWGHALNFQPEKIECAICGRTEDIPKFIRLAGGYKEVAYRFWMLNEFRTASCAESFPDDLDTDVVPDGTQPYPPIDDGGRNPITGPHKRYKFTHTVSDLDKSELETFRDEMRSQMDDDVVWTI